MVYIDDNEVKKYFESYVEAYGETVKTANKPGQEPEFYKALPYKVDVFKMPNEAIVAIMYGKAPKAMYNVYDSDYDTVAGYMKSKAHQQCLLYYPTKNFSVEDAQSDAKAAVARDTRSSVYRAGLMAARTHVEDTAKQIADIAKANPWLEKQLKDLEGKLIKSKAPLDKLWDEYKKMDMEECFAVQEMQLSELKGLEISGPADLDNRVVETYLKAYIDAYKGSVKPEYPEHAKPPFYKGAPYKVKAVILPNQSVAVLFKFGAVTESYDVGKGDYEGIKALIDNKEYDCFMNLPPLKELTDRRAITDAKLAVKDDIRNTLHLALLRSTAKVIADHQEKIKEIMKTNPWLEGPLTSVNSRLAGVGKLLEVLTGEIENNLLNARPPEQKRVLLEVSRYKRSRPSEEVDTGPVYATGPTVVEYPEGEIPTARAEVTARSTGPVYAEPEPAPQTYAAPPQVVAAAGMTEEERAAMSDLRAQIFEFKKKIDEAERKIAYWDKYIETQVQKRQDDKFKEQEEVYTAMIRKYSGVAVGLSVSAIMISLLVFFTNIGTILDSLRSLFGLGGGG
jgi:hypothetical protein